MRVQTLTASAAVAALGIAFVVYQSESDRTHRRLEPALGNPDVLRARYAEWKEGLMEAGGSRALVLGLGWNKAFSPGLARGEGSARFDLVAGRVDVEVRGFCEDEPLDVWLVENVPGAERSIAPEPGDRMAMLARLAPIDGALVFRGPIPSDLLGNFDLDLVVVTPANRSPVEEGLLYGSPDLFQRLYCREVRAARQDGAVRPRGIPLALVAPIDDCPPAECGGDIDCLVALGEKLFFGETFNGNGRTCGSCHPAGNNLTLDPEFIATLPDSDPLFIAEDRPYHPFPSLVFERPESFGFRFENPVLMRGQALILENVDGFPPLFSNSDRFTMRGVPHVFAQAVSIRRQEPPPGSPPLPKQRTGWSGDGSPSGDPALPGSNGSLRFFAAGAVRQHFTQNIQRRPGIDFRFPCDEELDAMEAFQLTLGRQADLALAGITFADPEVDTGRALFAGSRCNVCHNEAGAGFINTAVNGIRENRNFNTGVERFLTNHPDNTGEPRLADGGFGTNPQGNFTSLVANTDPTDGIFGNKQFNTPSLIEFADTLPGFHNNITSIAGQTALPNTVEGGILFYATPEFNASPSGPAINFGEVGTVQVGKFLRVLNALDNQEQSRGRAKLAAHLLGDPGGFNPDTVNRLLRVAVADITDAIEVLAGANIHPKARDQFAIARQELEGAMAGKAAARIEKIERAIVALDEAQANMILIP